MNVITNEFIDEEVNSRLKGFLASEILSGLNLKIVP